LHCVLRGASRKGQLAFGGVDSPHLTGIDAVDQQFGEGAVSTTDIKPAQAKLRLQPVEEHVACEPAPFTHEAFIGFAVVEPDPAIAHLFFFDLFGLQRIRFTWPAQQRSTSPVSDG